MNGTEGRLERKECEPLWMANSGHETPLCDLRELLFHSLSFQVCSTRYAVVLGEIIARFPHFPPHHSLFPLP
jgi:hypothetical protein